MSQHPVTTTDDHDSLTRFLIPGAGVRGVRVHLDDTWRQIRHASRIIPRRPPNCWARPHGRGRAVHRPRQGRRPPVGAAAQPRAPSAPCSPNAPPPAPCAASSSWPGRCDAVARPARTRRRRRARDHHREPAPRPPVPAEPMRYQGLVALESDHLAGAFEDYFRAVRAAAHAAAAGVRRHARGRPDAAEAARRCRRRRRLAACRARCSTPFAHRSCWTCPADTLLRRLFHEDGVQLLGSKPLRFACSCSRERVDAMLVSLGHEEARAAAADGEASVRCEFCGQRYTFPPEEIEALLRPSRPGNGGAGTGAIAPSADRRQLLNKHKPAKVVARNRGELHRSLPVVEQRHEDAIAANAACPAAGPWPGGRPRACAVRQRRALRQHGSSGLEQGQRQARSRPPARTHRARRSRRSLARGQQYARRRLRPGAGRHRSAWCATARPASPAPSATWSTIACWPSLDGDRSRGSPPGRRRRQPQPRGGNASAYRSAAAATPCPPG